MVPADELAYMSVTELAWRIRRRDLSPVEVVESAIARIEQRNPSINAFVYFGFDDARAAAQAAEQAIMRGDALGPLHGVPTAIKDRSTTSPAGPAPMGACAPSRTRSTMPIAPTPNGPSAPAPSR